ncbi:benzoate/H(+) symporter BenE family transporter [Gammaproteobacteria bacterium]|nr:benzoate/H(+) symporter BenE family transporter [Gammaproteobacteria bacterium]
MSIEQFNRPFPAFREVVRDFGLIYGVNGLIAFIFAASGPLAIILTMGSRGGLDQTQLSSWIFGAFFINSILSIGFCVLYRKPMVFFWTIPGTVLVGAALNHLSFSEVVGAFIATGALMLILGISGWVRRAMNVVPMPIVMAMVAGVFLQFGLDLVFAVRDGFVIAAPMCAMFVLLSVVGPLGRVLPPLIGALIAGVVAIVSTGAFNLADDAQLAFVAPTFVYPEFSIAAMIELVVPLAITVIVVQNGQGFAVLKAARHDPPVNAVTVACGGVSLLTAVTGTVSTCLTGPVNALISISGEHHRQYTAGIFVAVLGLFFGLFSSFFTALMLASPPAFIATLAGLAMLRVLQTSMTTAFGGTCTFGALITFLVTLADVPIFNLGAPFWGLVFGCTTSWVLERADYTRTISSAEDN